MHDPLALRSRDAPPQLHSPCELYIPGVSTDESERREALLAELRERIARHAWADETTSIDGVHLCAADRPSDPQASTSGTVQYGTVPAGPG